LSEHGHILELFPQHGVRRAVAGLYLAHRLHACGLPGEPFVYANFLSSLDGRIAVGDAPNNGSVIPDSMTTDNDWRLFEQLHAQADCLLTHGGYLRALAAGRLGDILSVRGGEGSELDEWRRRAGLARQPTVVVASASLDFPLPGSLNDAGRTVLIATGSRADPTRVRSWRERGYRVIVAGDGFMVEGPALLEALRDCGFRTMYLIAGPRMLETMMRHRLLSRLYLTLSHQIVGGEAFHTMLTGPQLGDAGRLRLESLYLDPPTRGGLGQWFAQFGCHHPL
jgi:riboflavin biosynthesis pyrimidine reductase